MRLTIESANNGFVLKRQVQDDADSITISSDQDELIEQLKAELINVKPVAGGKKRGRPAAAPTATAPAVDTPPAPVAPGAPAAAVGAGVPATPPAAAAAPTDIAKLRDAHRAFARASSTALARVGGKDKVKELNGKLIDDMNEAELAAAKARIQQEIDNLM